MIAASARCIVLVVETTRLSNRRWLFAPTKATPSSEAWARATACCQAQDDPAIADFRPARANIRDLLAALKKPADAASNAVPEKMRHSSQVRYSNRRTLCAKVAA